MIEFTQKGDFHKLTNYLEKLKSIGKFSSLDKFGQQGVAALKLATPQRTGTTASSWYYKIDYKKNSVTIGFYNSNINQNVPIAVILQYGHGTGTGAYVQGVDYINPALKPIFDAIADAAWKEVTSL